MGRGAVFTQQLTGAQRITFLIILGVVLVFVVTAIVLDHRFSKRRLPPSPITVQAVPPGACLACAWPVADRPPGCPMETMLARPQPQVAGQVRRERIRETRDGCP